MIGIIHILNQSLFQSTLYIWFKEYNIEGKNTAELVLIGIKFTSRLEERNFNEINTKIILECKINGIRAGKE